ncbi:MAG: polysaccharide lyase 8 family protein [Candidatus Pedobacter colombiensis]|uniref:Polysaccharide lyase 8 family protein n=1 Tax=Candidatus Pedobacter colombiensis TaxID=3121371 RepID=A0AAJ5WC77_9SPHI|nr:chondroitinase-AC [Pedobacter sp.]WEK20037.1 MAG: polysaccharide lyase 8 family protein [Pedobacter sp.]
MKRILLITALVLSMLIPRLTMAQSGDAAGLIMQRIVLDLKKPLRFIDKAAEKNLATLQANGSWKDIDYKVTTITNWQPGEHLLRLESLAQAYITKDSRYYSSDQAYDAITRALKYWYDQDPKSSNWWHNEIATPQALGEILILLRNGENRIPADLEALLIERMKRGDPEKQTGANKTDIALHYFYRALLTNNEALLATSTAELFDPIKFVHYKEGLQYDYSYLQHGPQLQISSYGAVFITGVLKMINYVQGTPYAINKEKLQMFSKYYRETYLKAIRGSYMDFNVEGRGVSRPNILRKNGEKNRLVIAAMVDPMHADEWKSAIARTDSTEAPDYKIEPLHKQFWIGDYVMHLRPGYSFNVRMVSNRTKRSESGNNENLFGRYLSDGATNIQVRGPEYYNIMPIWEWDKIPGTTTRDYQEDRLTSRFWGEDGSNAFAGGVSDGVYGASTYALNYDSLSAKKAWFFFDQEIVCLGADIHSNTPEPIVTTINQSWLNGDVLGSAIKGKFGKGKMEVFKNDQQNWMLHDGIGYVFPEAADVSLSTNIQKGSWSRINKAHPKGELSGSVFKLWINHGVKPEGAKYAYVVLPGIKNTTPLTNFNKSGIKILSNTAQVQAVSNEQLNMLQAVFYEPGVLKTSDYTIKSDKACVLLIKDLNSKMVISVADPLQKETNAMISITNIKDGRTTDYPVSFPQQAFAGSTVTLK